MVRASHCVGWGVGGRRYVLQFVALLRISADRFIFCKVRPGGKTADPDG
jgi:hypothetical protein